MKWKVILKIQIQDRKSRLNALIRKPLLACDMEYKIHSDTWEGAPVDAKEASEQLGHVIRILGEQTGGTMGHGPKLNHFWLYIGDAA